MKKMIEKHQALYNLLTKKLKYPKDIEIDSGFEGDSLWVNEEEEWSFAEASWKEGNPEWREDIGIEKNKKYYIQDGWILWK